jgi:hypothetical protein
MPVIIYARNRRGFFASHDDRADSRRGTTEAVKYQILVMFVIAGYVLGAVTALLGGDRRASPSSSRSARYAEDP